MVQSGTLCHVDFRCEQINDYQFDDQVQRYRGCQRSCQEWLSQKKPTETDNRISEMAARRRFVTANGIRANVQNPRLSDQTIIIRLHKHGFGSRISMKVPQMTDRHELAIGHLRDQLCRAVRVRLIPNHNLGHLRQFLRKELARIPQQSITTLVGSMRKRLAECIASHGGPTFLAFLPSAHPHQYNQCYECKTAICYE